MSQAAVMVIKKQVIELAEMGDASPLHGMNKLIDCLDGLV